MDSMGVEWCIHECLFASRKWADESGVRVSKACTENRWKFAHFISEG